MPNAKTVAELATLVGGELLRGDGSRVVQRVMPTDRADAGAVTFITKAKYLPSLATTQAAAVILQPDLLQREDVSVPEHVAVIGAARPYVAFARAAQALAERVPAPLGVHPAAVVEPTAEVGEGVALGPFVYVGPGATIGEGAVLYAGVHVEAGARIGPGSVLYNHVVVRHGCTVGARCVLHPGVVIGSDGFGFALDGEVAADGAPVHVKIPQVGDVVLEDDVELGANTCVDRGALGTTRIGAGTKIDNLVQIGHNVELGPGCVLVAQSGVAGSSRLGRGVVLGAQAGISGHLEIGERVMVYGQAGVMHDLPPGSHVLGSPAVPKGEFFRSVARIAKLDSLFARVKKLERLFGRESDG